MKKQEIDDSFYKGREGRDFILHPFQEFKIPSDRDSKNRRGRLVIIPSMESWVWILTSTILKEMIEVI